MIRYVILAFIVLDTSYSCKYAVADPYLRMALSYAVLLACSVVKSTPLGFIYNDDLRLICVATFFVSIITSIIDLDRMHAGISKFFIFNLNPLTL